MKLQSLPTAINTDALDALLDQFEKLGAVVNRDSMMICTVHTPKGVKVLSAARARPSTAWHVMCAPGLITPKHHIPE